MLKHLGRGIYRARWTLLLIALVTVALAGYYGIGVLDKLQGISSINDPTSESSRAQTFLGQKFSSGSTDVLVLLRHNQLHVDDPAFQSAATQLYDTLKQRPEIANIGFYYTDKNPALLSIDQHETLMTIEFTANSDHKFSYASIAPLLTSPTLQVYAGGSWASDAQFNDQINQDLVQAAIISLPLLALFLFFIFGGLVAALLPLLIGIIATIGSFAILRLIVNFMDVSDIAIHVVAFISLGLAIDYSLFIVTRFREEMVNCRDDVSQALSRTMATAGRTVMFSGLTVGTSLLCLLIFPEVLLRSVGLAAIASALVAVVASLTILTALLAVLGKRVNALSIRALFRRKEAGRQQQGMWYHLAQFAMRGAIPITILITALILTLGSPFLSAQFSTPDERSLPPDKSARIVVEHLKQNFANADKSSFEIAITTSGGVLSSDNLALLNSYVQKLKAVHDVQQITSLVTLDPKLTLADYQKLYANTAANPQIASAASQLANGNATKIIVTSTLADHSLEARDLARTIRAVPVPTGLTRMVTGTAAIDIDLLASLETTIPWALAVMFGSIFLLLFLLTGSLLMPIKAIVLNILSISVTFGALVWVFQEGHLQNILGFQSVGSLDSSQTVLIFAITFGLSMDYEIFLLSRIKEQFDLTGNNREAVAVGLQRTGWLITSAALLLAIVVGAFATSKIIFLKEIGVGIALAVLMDALVIRCLLVPAMMRLLGSANWWSPKPLKFIWRYIGLKETLDELPAQAGNESMDLRPLEGKTPVGPVGR